MIAFGGAYVLRKVFVIAFFMKHAKILRFLWNLTIFVDVLSSFVDVIKKKCLFHPSNMRRDVSYDISMED